MYALNKTWDHALKKISLKQLGIWIAVLVLLVAAIFFVRSCSRRNAGLHKNVYFIGRDSRWYPLKLFGKEKNLLAFTNDLMTEISREAGIQFHWLESSSESLLENLSYLEYDAVLSSLRPNPINRTDHLFSELVFETGPVLVVRKDSPIDSLKDIDGLTLGILSGPYPVFNAVRESGANDYDLIYVTYVNVNQLMEALVKNQIDGAIVDAIPAYTLAEGFYANKVKVVTPPLNDEGLRLVTMISDPSQSFIDTFNEVLDKMKEDGTYDFLISKWDLINPEKRFQGGKG